MIDVLPLSLSFIAPYLKFSTNCYGRIALRQRLACLNVLLAPLSCDVFFAALLLPPLAPMKHAVFAIGSGDMIHGFLGALAGL